MAFSKVASAQAYSSFSNNITVDKPTGVQEGDIMFAIVCQYTIGNIIYPPSGWTVLFEKGGDSYGCCCTYYKVAGASEPADYDWSSNRTKKTLVAIVAYRDGFDVSDPIDAVSVIEYQNNLGKLNRAAGISVSAANSPLLWMGGFYYQKAGSTTTPTAPEDDWVEDLDSGHADADFWVAFFSQIWSGSGSTGDVDATISVTTRDRHASLVALNPAIEPTNKRSQFLLLNRDYPVEVRNYPVIP